MPVLTGLIASGLSAIGAGAIGGGALIITPGLTFGLTTGAAALAGSISTAVLTIGASYGLNVALGTFNKKGSMQRNDITIRQALPGRWIDIGRVKTGGAIAFYASPSTYLHSVKVMSCTKIQEIETMYLDDWPTTNPALNSGGVVGSLMGPWTSLVLAEARLGTEDQSALSLPQAAGSWTTAHRLRGCASLALTYAQGPKDKFTQFYPNGPPNATWVIKGAMLPDPSNPAHDLSDPGTWDYSDNGSRAVARFGLDRDGWGLAPDDFNGPILQQAVIDSAEAVATPSGTEPRYRACGRYSTLENRSSTLKAMLENMGAVLLEQPDGTLGLFVGKDRTPTITIDETMIIDVQLKRYPDALDRVDAVKARITWEGAGWEEQECPPVFSGEAYYGSAPDIQDLALPWCPSPYQAQRLSKAALRRARPEWSGTIKTWLHGLRCCGEPVVRLVYPELGIDGTFEIVTPPALDTSSMTVSLSVRSIAPDTWTMEAEEFSEMGLAALTDYDYNPPAPEEMEASPSGLVVTVTWDVLPDEDAYTYEVQWRTYDSEAGAEDNWVSLDPSATSPGASTAIVTVGAPGTYDVRARRVSSRGFLSDWTVLPEIEVA